MTRFEKCELAIKIGFSYDKNTGFIITPTGVVASKTSSNGYIQLTIRHNGAAYYLYGHQFAWYYENKETVPLIDHENRIKTDNRILNLRSITKQQNAFNMKVKGCSFDRRSNKWISYIMVDGKKKHLGTFANEADAKDCYNQAKNKYHLIN